MQIRLGIYFYITSIFVTLFSTYTFSLNKNVLNRSYSSKINGYLYLRRVSPPLKKCRDMSSESEGNAVYPCDCPLQIVMAAWRTFFNLNFLSRAWQSSADKNGCLTCFKFLKKCAKRPLLSAEGCHNDQITQQNSLYRGQGGLKCSKGLISRPILDLEFF
jgi:hypothetical protein